MRLTSILEDVCSIPVGQGSGVAVSSDLVWLWCRLAAAALIRPLAWERPHGTGAAPKRKNGEGSPWAPLVAQQCLLPSRRLMTSVNRESVFLLGV